MLMECSLEVERAREKWLDAKKRYEEFRDGYLPYLDDKEEFGKELEEYMGAMDCAEDWYNLCRFEYDSVLTEELSGILYDETDEKRPIFKTNLEELYDIAVEAKERYDELAEGRNSWPINSDELAKELERLRHEWRKALDDYDEAYDQMKLALKKEELDNE